MKLETCYTADGSVTLLNTTLNATYHSRYGAMQESRHIYMDCGLNYGVTSFGNNLNVFEMGFGTGLNAWLTQQEAKQRGLFINYTGIEKYPVPPGLFESFNYAQVAEAKKDLDIILRAAWEFPVAVGNSFTLSKQRMDVRDAAFPKGLHVVYYDAFDPQTAPECWEPGIFERIYNTMHQYACLVTFCAKGQVKRLLKETGFMVESLTGPPGKREITRAIKY